MIKICRAILTVVIGLLIVHSNAMAKTPPVVQKGDNPALAVMLQKVMPAVVNITAQGDAPFSMNSKQPRGYLPNQMERFQAVGSGVIVDANNGYIITNAHVLRHADVLIITLSDGRKFKAKKIGEDLPTDVSVLQIEARHLEAIPFANSNNLKVGDFVAAIGNPFGLQQTVTSGMVSALNRSVGIEGPLGFENFIQTDASINPGNSGGALVDINGKLVGINTAILTPAGGNIGIGFAIPSNMANNVMEQLIRNGHVQRGMLGVMVQNLTPDLADAFHIPDAKGALVTQVTVSSPAAIIGIKVKDVIEKINGEVITNASQLRALIGTLPVGTKLDIDALRDRRLVHFSTDITEIKKERNSSAHLLSGLRLSNFDQFDPALGEIKGALVLQVNDSSDAWLAGLRPGDVILSANDQPITDIDHLTRIADHNSKQLLLKIRRADGMLFIAIT